MERSIQMNPSGNQSPASVRRLGRDLPSESVERLPELKICGVSVFDPIWARGFHADSRAELLCLMRGKMTLVFQDRRFSMAPGDFAFVAPNTPHRDLFEADAEPEVFMACFSWAAESEFFQAVSNEALANLTNWRRSETLRTIMDLRDQAVSDLPLDHILARSRLHALLLGLWSSILARRETPGFPAEGTSDRRHDLMLRTRRYIENHYHEHVSLEGIAAHLQVSSYYLSRVFSHESGFSLTAYLTSVRLQRAYEKLRDGTKNVSETAFAVGYESSAYFSRVFKQHFGMAPSKVPRREPPPRT